MAQAWLLRAEAGYRSAFGSIGSVSRPQPPAPSLQPQRGHAVTSLSWMAWTMPVAIFFAGIGALLVAMTVWERVSPTVPRRGWLPIVTTRGDRLFIGLLIAAYVNLAWTGFTDLNQWFGALLGAAAVAAVMRWG